MSLEVGEVCNMKNTYKGTLFPIEAELFIKQYPSDGELWSVTSPLSKPSLSVLPNKMQQLLLAASEEKTRIPEFLSLAIEENREVRMAEGFAPGSPVSVKILLTNTDIAYITPIINHKEF